MKNNQKRKIYLVRHGMPDFPGGKRVCLGHTDLPISPVGRMQAMLAANSLKKIDASEDSDKAGLSSSGLSLFSSNLKRAKETADFFGEAEVVEGLEEMNFGEWDGFSFDEIKVRWPELYEARGLDNSIQPPGAENNDEAYTRFDSALRKILGATTGDIRIVSHASVMRAFFSHLLKKDLPPGRTLLPYGSISELSYEEGIFNIEYMGKANTPPLTEDLCLDLLSAAGTPQHVIRHSVAVAEEAEKIVNALIEKGINLDSNLIINSALLHDVARVEKDHAKVGGKWIDALGYHREAELISSHIDSILFEVPDETSVLIAADQVVSEDEVVGLNERFRRVAKKFGDEKIKKIVYANLQIAEKNIKTINRICGREIVKL